MCLCMYAPHRMDLNKIAQACKMLCMVDWSVACKTFNPRPCSLNLSCSLASAWYQQGREQAARSILWGILFHRGIVCYPPRPLECFLPLHQLSWFWMENLFHSKFRHVLHLEDENTIVEQCQCMLGNVSDQINLWFVWLLIDMPLHTRISWNEWICILMPLLAFNLSLVFLCVQ